MENKTTNLNSSDFDFSDEFVEWPLGDLLEDFFLQQYNRIKIMPLKIDIKTREGKDPNQNCSKERNLCRLPIAFFFNKFLLSVASSY